MKKETFEAECREEGIRWNDMVEIGVWYPRTSLGYTVGYGVKYFTGALGHGYYDHSKNHAPYGDYVILCIMREGNKKKGITSKSDFLCFEFEQIASINLITH